MQGRVHKAGRGNGGDALEQDIGRWERVRRSEMWSVGGRRRHAWGRGLSESQGGRALRLGLGVRQWGCAGGGGGGGKASGVRGGGRRRRVLS